METETKETEPTNLIQETLLRKKSTYKEINDWYKTEYDSLIEEEEVEEMDKRAIETKAQIKVLEFILSEIKESK